jgi:hypothetical protein
MTSVLDRSRIELGPSPAEPPAPRAAPARRPSVTDLGGWLGGLLGLRRPSAKPRWRRVPIEVQSQLQSQWCWAACSTSISHLYDTGSRWTQCKVVNAELAQTGCCRDGSTGQCNQPWYLDRALTRTGNLAGRSPGLASVSKLRSQLGAGRPVGARVGWAGGGGHFVKISGCLDDATGILEVRDPIYGTSEISVAAFAASYQGSGSWTHTYFTER